VLARENPFRNEDEAMKPTTRRAIRSWLRRRIDDFAVALIGIMFISFLLQIGFRYFLNQPLGWTEEVTVLCWVWVVLWGAAFVLSESDEIRFDIIYGLVSARARRAFIVITGLALIALLAVSLPATWHYVTFMKREHSAYLHLPFNVLYVIYPVFAVAVIVKYVRLVWRAIRGANAPEGAIDRIESI